MDLRVASAYRTVSTGVILIVAGIIIIHLMACGRCRLWRFQNNGLENAGRVEVKYTHYAVFENAFYDLYNLTSTRLEDRTCGNNVLDHSYSIVCCERDSKQVVCGDDDDVFHHDHRRRVPSHTPQASSSLSPEETPSTSSVCTPNRAFERVCT
ncbi:Hypothetical protein CINCED_3A012929 [Cinara cedri]|uniref:Uncharacterized protein n=1 Tax=Cinara cedri TaxID=506608 RepID=A0A5E4MU24_9HEMI|nr:Hypothetical protein CINCED_3A012929 [Cinara cedri]